MSNHRLLPGLAVGLSALLLSGCAGTATPGVAATVGDETISTSRIDKATGHMCTALADQFKDQTVPLGVIRQGVVQLLALSAQTDQIADDYGVSPSTTYESDVAVRTSVAAKLPEEVRKDYIEVMSAQAKAKDVAQQVGKAQLAAQGFTEPTDEQITQAGFDAFQKWPDAHGVEVNPKYGFKLVNGTMTATDTNLSFAVSDEAKAGSATQTDPGYADSLPPSQRCGG